jgi:hypothetical protein
LLAGVYGCFASFNDPINIHFQSTVRASRDLSLEELSAVFNDAKPIPHIDTQKTLFNEQSCKLNENSEAIFSRWLKKV